MTWFSFFSIAIKFFCLRCLACRWNRLEFASPHLSHVILDLILATERSSEDRARESFFKADSSQASSWLSALISLAISNWWMISLAFSSCALKCPTFLSLQLWRPLAVALSLEEKVSKGHLVAGTDSQAKRTASWKPSNWGQKSSKWNLLFPWCVIQSQDEWTVVRIFRSWALQQIIRELMIPVNRAKYSVQLDKHWELPETELAQVNLLPTRGISLMAKSLITIWNLPIIVRFRFELFLSSSL